MAKLNFHVHDNFRTFVTQEASLEAARASEADAGGNGDGIIAFVSVESTNEAGLDLLEAAHNAQLDGNRDSALEELAGQIFKAGVEYARAEVRKRALGSLGLE